MLSGKKILSTIQGGILYPLFFSQKGVQEAQKDRQNNHSIIDAITKHDLYSQFFVNST